MNKYTHKIRHAAYLAEENGGFWPPDLSGIQALTAELIGVDTEEIKQHRIACQGASGYVENSPELYGRSLADTIKHYYKGGSFVECKDDCDAELSEIDKAIVGATIHAGDMEKPL